MESGGIEEKINIFLQKFQETSARAIEDELLFDDSGGVITRSKFDMDYDGMEMTGIASDNLIRATQNVTCPRVPL
jgi:hypothetical protein